MAAEMREFRAPARDLLVGDLATWHQHAFCEVVERSYGPDPATIRTDDGRFIPVPPGEWVEVRRLEEATDPAGEGDALHPPASHTVPMDGPSPAGPDDEILALGPDAEMGGLPLIERAYEQIDALIDAAQLLRILLRQIGAGGAVEP